MKGAVFLTLPHHLSPHLLEHFCQGRFISRKSSLSLTLSDSFSPKTIFCFQKKGSHCFLEYFSSKKLHTEGLKAQPSVTGRFFLQEQQ